MCWWPVTNYDAKQRAAILVRCVRCDRWWFMTEPRFICLGCQGTAARREP